MAETIREALARFQCVLSDEVYKQALYSTEEGTLELVEYLIDNDVTPHDLGCKIWSDRMKSEAERKKAHAKLKKVNKARKAGKKPVGKKNKKSKVDKIGESLGFLGSRAIMKRRKMNDREGATFE